MIRQKIRAFYNAIPNGEEQKKRCPIDGKKAAWIGAAALALVAAVCLLAAPDKDGEPTSEPDDADEDDE